MYIDNNKDKYQESEPNEDSKIEKKVYPKVDIHKAMKEIEDSMGKITTLVKKDLDAIAALDITMRIPPTTKRKKQ